MSLSETAVSKFPSGSGRTVDWLYPAQDANRSSNASNLNIQSRLTGDGSVQALGAVGTGTATFAVHNGVPCVNVATTAVANGISYASDNVWACKAILTKGHGMPASYNAYACWRYAATIAFDVVPASSYDYGFELILGGNGTFPFILQSVIGGMGFCRRPSGSVSLIIQGAGLNEFPITTPGFDPTVFHQYELRVISAGKTNEAVFRSFVDGVPFQSFGWGAGTILPSYIGTGGTYGGICNKAPTAGVRLWVYDVQVSASSSEAGLL